MTIVWHSFFLGVVCTFIFSSLLLWLLVSISDERSTLRNKPMAKKALVKIH